VTPGPDNALQRRARDLTRADPLRVRARRGRAAHRRFAPAEPPHPGWLSLAPQRHVRGLAAGGDQLRVWLATWGGVLCWTPADGRVERHASEHGLLGNAVRCVAVDPAGVVWAGQDAGLCTLDPAAGWVPHPGLRGRTVLRLAARPAGGVWAALRDAAARETIGHVAAPGAPFRELVGDALASTGVLALLADGDAGEDAVWAANAWGVFRCQAHAPPAPFDLSRDAEGNRDVQVQVHALAPRAAGGLWAGTNWGLYALDGAPDPARPAGAVPGVPAEPVRALAGEWGTGRLVVVTDGQVGVLLEDGAWRPVAHALAAPPAVALSAPIEGAGRTWVGGAAGLHELGPAGLAEAFPPSPDDALGGAVRCLTVAPEGVWAGTARGLFVCDGRDGQVRAADDGAAHDGVPAHGAPGRWDVRALAPGAGPDDVWAGTWLGGMRALSAGVYVPGAPPDAPAVAVAADGAGGAWFATLDAVHLARAGEARRAAAWRSRAGRA
jgi:ligand-binding sensor domain-containing protein